MRDYCFLVVSGNFIIGERNTTGHLNNSSSCMVREPVGVVSVLFVNTSIYMFFDKYFENYVFLSKTYYQLQS